MAEPKKRSFATPLEWFGSRQTDTPARPSGLPASLLGRTRLALLVLGIVTSVGLGPFALRDPLVPLAWRIAAISGIVTLVVAWLAAYRAKRQRLAGLLFEGAAIFAVCSGVGAPQLGVGLVSVAIFYSAMFADLRVARAAALVYGGAFVASVALTSHPKALPVWSPGTLSPLFQFAVLGALLYSMGRMIERTEREQERALALRGLGEALGAARGADHVFAAWLDASMAIASPAGATGACALRSEAGAWRTSGGRGALAAIGDRTVARSAIAADAPDDFEIDEAAALDALGAAGSAPHAYRFLARSPDESGAAVALIVASTDPLPDETCAQLAAAAHNANVALDLERSRAAIVRAERLAAIGQLAASMAHELRNPLAAIRGAATYLKRVAETAPTKPPARAFEFLDLIEREVGASNRIISDVLDFAKNRTPMRSPTAIRGLVEEVRSIVALGDARLDNEVPADLPPHGLDRDQIRQALANLVQNGADAAAETGGAVVVRASGGGDAPLVVEVEDTGTGMAPEVAERAFEPLYTTKNKGTGLGLSIVAKIVAAHGGAIRTDTKPGRGTRFVIEIPPEGAPAITGR